MESEDENFGTSGGVTGGVQTVNTKKHYSGPLFLGNLRFFIWEVQDSFARRGKANKNLLGSKNLFSKS